MINKLSSIYQELYNNNNNNNKFIYYLNNERVVKTFNEFINDVDSCITRLKTLSTNKGKTVGILGPLSYTWAVLDHACLKGGFKSVAIPEVFSNDDINKIIEDCSADIILCDINLKDTIIFNRPSDIYYFNCDSNYRAKDNFFGFPIENSASLRECNIRRDYTIVFSSGTSDKIKKIEKKFPDLPPAPKLNLISRLVIPILKMTSFWSRKNNKLILFLPFSHSIQRDSLMLALNNKISVVLSEPRSIIKHIILEKPNIMFSVPFVYNLLAFFVSKKIERFGRLKKGAFFIYNKLGINSLSDRNLLKKVFIVLFFKNIYKLLGGRSDFYVSGSAPADVEDLKVLYKVGLKVFEAYGQTETINISLNHHRSFRFGSVGKPMCEVKINEDSEILIKYDKNLNDVNDDVLNVSLDGYVHTGDLGYLDKDGYLFITGRKDDVIVLKNGKKVYPSKIEILLNRKEDISHGLVYSGDGLTIQAIISAHKIRDMEKFSNLIKDINSKLAKHEQILKFHVINDEFTVENKMLTSTFKLKRKAILEKYENKKFHWV